MPDTPLFALPWPADGAPVDVSSHIENLAVRLDTVLDTLATKAAYATVASLNSVNSTLTNSINSLTTSLNNLTTRMNNAEAKLPRTTSNTMWGYTRAGNATVTVVNGEGYITHSLGDVPSLAVVTPRSSGGTMYTCIVTALTSTRIEIKVMNTVNNTYPDGSVGVYWVAMGS